MAKWGEGDPRWIVEERADAKNVNNWHWSEKDATQWSKDKLKELLLNFILENSVCSCKINEISKLEGEANVNNRKGKLIFFYEWEIEVKWIGNLIHGDNKTEFTGTIEIPNLSEEYSIDEVDVTVLCSSSSKDGQLVKDSLRSMATSKLRERLNKYIVDLKSEYSRGLILPTKNGASQDSVKSVTTVNTAKMALNTPVVSSNANSSVASGVKIITKKLSVQEEFFCSPDDLYRAFTERDLMRAFTRSEVSFHKEKGGKFALFGGTITGYLDELNLNESLVMRWRHTSWKPDEHYSQVVLTFKPCTNGTMLELVQNGVPDRYLDDTKRGWSTNYFEAIKQTFGYGGRMF